MDQAVCSPSMRSRELWFLLSSTPLIRGRCNKGPVFRSAAESLTDLPSVAFFAIIVSDLNSLDLSPGMWNHVHEARVGSTKYGSRS